MAPPAHLPRGLGAWFALAVLSIVLGGCSAASAPSTSTSSFTPATPVVTPVAATSTPAVASPILDACRARIGGAEFFQIGRKLTATEVDALTLVLQTPQSEGQVGGYLFTDGEHDFECFGPLPYHCDPQYGDCPISVDADGYPERFATRLNADRVVAEGPTGGSSEGPYLFSWGAVAPEVSRITVRIGNNDGFEETEAVIEAGYYLALINGAELCCLTEYTAYDSSGAVLFETERDYWP